MSFSEEQVEEVWDGEWYDENGELVAEGDYEYQFGEEGNNGEEGSFNHESEENCSHSSFEAPKEEDSVSVRTRITMEVLETERNYVDNINFVVEFYLKPLRARMDTPTQVIKPTAFEKVFGNLEDVLAVNRKFLKLLEERINSSFDPERTTISDIFLSSIPTFGPAYKPYLEHHQRTIDKLRDLDKKSSWQAFLNEVKEKPDFRKGELTFFLIQPVQRCPRYELLLNQLIKHTPETHPDFKGLNKALEDSQELVISANEEMRKHEELKILHKIEGKWVNIPKGLKIAVLGRKKVKEGNIYKVCRRESKRRFFVLFNDLLIYGAHQASGNYKYSLHIDLTSSKSRIQNLQDKGDLVNAFVIRSQEKSFTVFTDTPQEKQSWMSSIEAILTAGGKNQMTKPKSGSFLNGNGASTLDSSLVIESSDIDSEEAPVWIPDKDFDFCMICAVSFNTFRRKHHCRICGKLVCGSCSAQKAVLQNTQKKSAERICKICHGIKQLRHQQQQAEKQAEQDKVDMLKKMQPGGSIGFNYFGGGGSPNGSKSFLRSSDESQSARSSVIGGARVSVIGGGSGSDDEKKKKSSTIFRKVSKRDVVGTSSPQLTVKELPPALITTSHKVTAPTATNQPSQPAIKLTLPPGGLASLKSYSTSNLNSVSSAGLTKQRPNNAVNSLASKMMASNSSPNLNAPNSTPSSPAIQTPVPQGNHSSDKPKNASFMVPNSADKIKPPSTGSFLNLSRPTVTRQPATSAPAPSSTAPKTPELSPASEHVNTEETRGRSARSPVQPSSAIVNNATNMANRSQTNLLGSGRPLPTPTRSPSTSFSSGENNEVSRPPAVARSATSGGFGTGRPLPQVPK